MAAIRTDGLTKVYPGERRIPGVRQRSPPVTALETLDLVVEEGEVFGFLGPNGAGKSTTINILLDYVRPTEGTATVLGMDAQAETAAIHDRHGVLPEEPGFYDRLTARKHLRLATRTKGAADDPMTVLERVGLGDAADRTVGGFSTGMRQRLGLAIALVGQPELLILDEPTAGLDPNAVRRLRAIVEEEVDRGATVFFSSHVLEQVEAICDRVGILRDGELVALDTIEGLRDELGSGDTLSVTVDSVPEGATDLVGDLGGIADASVDRNTVSATCTTGRAKVGVIDTLQEAGATVVDIDVDSTDLESLFTAYAGSDRDEDADVSSSDAALADTGSAAADEPTEVSDR